MTTKAMKQFCKNLRRNRSKIAALQPDIKAFANVCAYSYNNGCVCGVGAGLSRATRRAIYKRGLNTGTGVHSLVIHGELKIGDDVEITALQEFQVAHDAVLSGCCSVEYFKEVIDAFLAKWDPVCSTIN